MVDLGEFALFKLSATIKMFMNCLTHFISLLILTRSTKVYRFEEQRNTDKEVSHLKVEVPLIDEMKISLCFSYKQDQFNAHTQASFIDNNTPNHYYVHVQLSC